MNTLNLARECGATVNDVREHWQARNYRITFAEADLDAFAERIRADAWAIRDHAAGRPEPSIHAGLRAVEGKLGAAPETGERAAFEASDLTKHLDLSIGSDAWKRDIYAHSHVEAMFAGWKAGRAALAASQPSTPERKPPTESQANALWAKCLATHKRPGPLDLIEAYLAWDGITEDGQ